MLFSSLSLIIAEMSPQGLKCDLFNGLKPGFMRLLKIELIKDALIASIFPF